MMTNLLALVGIIALIMVALGIILPED